MMLLILCIHLNLQISTFTFSPYSATVMYFTQSASTAQHSHYTSPYYYSSNYLIKTHINHFKITQTPLFMFRMSIPLSFLPPSVILDSLKPLLKAFPVLCSLFISIWRQQASVLSAVSKRSDVVPSSLHHACQICWLDLCTQHHTDAK